MQQILQQKKMSNGYRFLDVSGNFEAFPNGHRKFLTPSALRKVNIGREDCQNLADHTLSVGYVPKPPQIRREQEVFLDTRPDLPGEFLRPNHRSGGTNHPHRDQPAFVTEEDWLTTYEESIAKQSFQSTSIAEQSFQITSIAEQSSRSTSIAEQSSRSTSIAEGPTLLGDTANGRISTLRLRALRGKTIDVCAGESILLRVDGKGPRAGETIYLDVLDIIYGNIAYVNLLVDGGTTGSGGGRSTSRSAAFVRVTL